MENNKTNHDKIILKAISTINKRNDSWKIRRLKNCPNISNYLIHRYNDSLSRTETIMRMRLGIEVRPICPTCGNNTQFTNKINNPFTIYCCHECSYNAKEKIKKYENTCLERYGFTTPLKDKKRREIGKNTCIKKYGVEFASQSNDIKRKIRNTCIKKYGVEWISKSNEWKEKMSVIMQSETTQSHRILKLKAHKTFNTSKPEEELFLYIKEKFPSVKRQYKDNARYPWCCDFYIPEFDLFLELQGTWTHGKHAFDKNSKEDQLILEQWKKKSEEHPFYLNAIKTWTERDVEKRNTAKENKLNFKEVWSSNEGKSFIDELH